MQTELFKSEITNNAQNATQVKAEITPIQEWREMLSKTISLRKQESLLLNENQNEIMVYHSGASSIADLKGYIASKSYVGICAIDTSQNALNLLIEYSENGGKVFADSGAFRHFRQKLKRPDTPDLDFNLILEKYHKLASANEGSHKITVVAPDVVGNQKSSQKVSLDL
ncbi:hypothetical protein [Pseudoalteromonas marina]|uniref:Uncharacterized protein n=1 Tax=Pseudoalteromonas marina TaxID=267375 RepID=A0ABT9FI55_9GAMM|nr:hypothetical protein [Pseudoalteromonas marina]MDP2566472.1 hypothetical protein [Pseudoalteromonas marina]